MSTAATEREWSVSAAHLYRDVCPLQWSHRYGPHRERRAGRGACAPMYRLRGRLLHDAIRAAYVAAGTELDATPGGLAGARMDRYWPAARRALNTAWIAEGRPGDADAMLETLALLHDLLTALPVPRPGTIYAVEQRIRARLDSGLPVVAIPDRVLWVEPGRIRVTDWKTPRVDPAEVLRSQQLLVYAWLLAAADPRITAVEIELFSIRGLTGHVRTPPPALTLAAVDRLDRTARQAEADTDPQPRPGGHCATCPFTARCPAVGRGA